MVKAKSVCFASGGYDHLRVDRRVGYIVLLITVSVLAGTSSPALVPCAHPLDIFADSQQFPGGWVGSRVLSLGQQYER